MRATLTALLCSSRHRALRYRWAIILYLVVLAAGCIPGARADIGHYASGLVLHSTGYGVLTFLLFSGSRGSAWQCAVKAVLSVMLMGALDEIVQSFFPYRHGSVGDWLVDCAAATVCAAVLLLVWPKAGHPLVA